jgi:hypothetical protein
VPQGHLPVRVAAAEPQPRDAKQAAPDIERFLVSQQKAETARAELKQLRDAARIEYVGAFTGAPADQPVAPRPGPGAAPVETASGAMDGGIGGLR